MRGATMGRTAILLAAVWAGGCGGDGDAAGDVAADGAAGSPLAQAQTLMQNGDYEGAEALLEEFTSSHPDTARAWAMLGTAHVQTGRIDETFDAWNRAKESGRFDITQIGLNPATEAVRDDPRYQDLFPTAAEFADPFVEPAEVLQEWVGESAGDQFGWIARSIGDVDGDGIADVTTSAPTWGDGGSARGRVYTYSGGTGALLWTADGEPGDQLGQGIEAAGDVNGDGVPDVIAGAPGGDRTLIWSGRDALPLLQLTAPDPGHGFGGMVSDVGDVNGDGHDDILVGAPGSGAGTGTSDEWPGRAYLYSGSDGSILFEWVGESAGHAFGSSGAGWVGEGADGLVVVGSPGAGPNGAGRVYVYGVEVGPEGGVSDRPKFVIESDEGGSALGAMFVSVVGDVNGDGAPDVYASDWAHGALGPGTGRIHVHSGSTGQRLLTLTGEAAGDGFGIGPADAGDVDGDGRDDLIVGAWQHRGAAASGGKLYVHSGADGALLRTITGKVMGETLGFDATGMGDVDGDGTPDFLVTSAWSAIAGPRSGRVFILSGGLERVP